MAIELDQALQDYKDEAKEMLERITLQISRVNGEAFSKSDLDALYRDVHTLKGSSQLFGFQKTAQVSHALESYLELFRKETARLDSSVLDTVLSAVDILKAISQYVELYKKEPLSEPRVEKICSDLLEMAKDAIESSSQDFITSAESALNLSPVEKGSPILEESLADTIRLPVSVLDNLMNLAGELVLIRNQILQQAKTSSSDEFQKVSYRLNILTTELQNEVMLTRMQSISGVLNKFYRMVRDTSRQIGKRIDLVLEGSETELDKTLVEAVKDPLTHIVRNAIDHGIESPADRLRRGKSETGKITITSYHESGQVVIKIRDDGKGLDEAGIKQKAVEKKIVSEERASNLTFREICGLIFEPGFSTAEEVSDLSGRGVGMDIVRTNIERIGGNVEVFSKPGEGTTITLRIPLTLAIMPALIIKSQGRIYAIPQSKIAELMRLNYVSNYGVLEQIEGKDVLRLRGEIIPYVELKSVLQQTDSETSSLDRIVAILTSDRGYFALAFDDIEDSSEIVVKPMHSAVASLDVYSGATIMGDGTVALILDINGLATKAGLEGDLEGASDREVKRVTETSNLNEYIAVETFDHMKVVIPMGSVSRLEEFKSSDVLQSIEGSFVKYREHLLPFLNLSAVVSSKKIESTHFTLNSQSELGNLHTVVVSSAARTFGFVVKSILDVLYVADVYADDTRRNPFISGKISVAEEIYSVVDTQAIFVDLRRHFKVGQSIETDALSQLRKKYRILVAEDSSFYRNQIGLVLQDAGYVSDFCPNGLVALQTLRSHPQKYSLVLSDVEMPEMSGLELATQIRAADELRGLPVVAITTRYSKVDCDIGLKAGFNRYLEKLNADEVVKELDALLAIA